MKTIYCEFNEGKIVVYYKVLSFVYVSESYIKAVCVDHKGNIVSLGIKRLKIISWYSYWKGIYLK